MTSSKEQQELYAVRLLFEATHPDEPGPSQMWEDRIVVVRAASEDEAESRARELTASQRHEYKNEFDNRVAWQLVDVLDVKRLLDGTLHEGMEVYYSLLDADAADALRRSVGKPRP